MLILLFLVAFLLLFLAITLWAFNKTFYSSPDVRADAYEPVTGEQYDPVWKNMLAGTKAVDALPFEQVYTTSHDGLKLAARYFHDHDGAPVQIIFHGYRSPANRDGSGGTFLAFKCGCNVLLVDQRAHGLSEGTVISFGVKERYDVQAWVKYASDRFGKDTPILLSGMSMGAATVLMASDLPMEGNVKGIIADCPYASPEAIIQKVCRDLHYPDKLTKPFVHAAAWLFGHFSLTESSAISSVARTNLPILLIHGDDDRFVPVEMSRQIAAVANGNIRCEFIPNAGHGLCYLKDKERYSQVVMDFAKDVL